MHTRYCLWLALNMLDIKGDEALESCIAAFEYNWKPKTGRDLIGLLYPRSLRTRSLRYPITREKREEVLSVK